MNDRADYARVNNNRSILNEMFGSAELLMEPRNYGSPNPGAAELLVEISTIYPSLLRSIKLARHFSSSRFTERLDEIEAAATKEYNTLFPKLRSMILHHRDLLATHPDKYDNVARVAPLVDRALAYTAHLAWKEETPYSQMKNLLSSMGFQVIEEAIGETWVVLKVDLGKELIQIEGFPKRELNNQSDGKVQEWRFERATGNFTEMAVLC